MLTETDNFSGFFAQNINFFKLKFRVFLKGNVEQVSWKHHSETLLTVEDGVSVDEFVPVMAVPDLDERGGLYADVLLVDGVVENEFVVDEFFDELGFFDLSVVLVDWDFVGLDEVEVLFLDLSSEDLGGWVCAEALILQAPDWVIHDFLSHSIQLFIMFIIFVILEKYHHQLPLSLLLLFFRLSFNSFAAPDVKFYV